MALRTLKDKFEFWAEQQPALNFIATVLEWFSITVEVFLRRDFGERYFNRSKVTSGFLVIAIWSFLSKVGSGLSRPTMSLFQSEEPPPEPSFSLGGAAATLILLLYLVLCGYHSFSIWWRNSTGRPLHSWDAGKSWLTPIGQLIMVGANKLMGLFCRIFAFTLPPDQRASLMQSPPPAMNDAVLFTERYIEPLTVFALALVCMKFDVGALGSWLLLSTAGLLFWTNIRHEKEREEMLDMRDSLIKSRYMTEAIIHGETDGLRIKSNVKEIVQQMSIQAAAAPETMEQFRQGAPSLANAMEALNPKLRNLAATTPSEPLVKEAIIVKEEQPQPTPPPALASAMEALNPKFRNLATNTPSESPVKENTVMREEPPSTPPPAKEEPSFVGSMPLKSEYLVKETIVVKKEPQQPALAPPPAFTSREERPLVVPQHHPIQTKEKSPIRTPIGVTKTLKVLLIVAGLAIVGLVLFFVVSSVLKKSDAPVKELEKTETPTPSSPEPELSTSPPPSPPSTEKVKGQIQTEGGGIVNMRDLPSEDGAVVIPIPTGAEVIIFRYGEDTVLKNGEQGRWCRIAYKAQLGWVWGKYVKEK